MKKRMLSYALALCFVISLLQVSSFAAGELFDVSTYSFSSNIGFAFEESMLAAAATNAHVQVMTADEFINYLYVALNRQTRYSNEFPYNVGYYDGTYISWDCWHLGETILATRGQAVYNYSEKTYASAWMDKSIGLTGQSGDWLENACSDTLKSDFSDIVPGEWLFKDDLSGNCYHVGYYVGNNKVIEMTSDGTANVQISTIDEEGHSGLGKRGSSWKWTYHAKVPWITYCPHNTDYYNNGHCTLSGCGAWLPNDNDNASCSVGTYEVSSGKTAYFRVHPYKASDETIDELIACLGPGTRVSVTGAVINGFGNTWYKVSYGGRTGYIVSSSLEYVSAAASTLSINPASTSYTIVQGNSCSVTGSITSNYDITKITATLDGSQYVNLTPNAKSVNIGATGSGQINSFKGAELSVGTHYIVITATDASPKTITRTITITVTGTSSHTHDKGTFLFFEAAHPHRNAYKCSICGETWVDYDSSNYYSNCETCSQPPEKPVVSTASSQYWGGQTVTVTWNAIANNEQYCINVYLNNALIYEAGLGNQTSYTLTAQAGKYDIYVSANNAAGTSGAAGCSFTVDQAAITYDANGGIGAPPVQPFTYNNGERFSQIVPRREGYTFIGWVNDNSDRYYYPGDPIPASWGSCTMVAQWQINSYTVKFANDDGTVLSENTYVYGTVATSIILPSDPVKAATEQYTYTFAGWSPEIVNVTGDAIYTATYTSNLLIRVTGIMSEDGKTLIGWKVSSIPENALLIAARYDNGKQTDLSAIMITSKSGELNLGGSGNHFKLFLLNRTTYSPLCAGWDSDMA